MTMGADLGWYWRRLRVMQPAELLFRLVERTDLALLGLRHQAGFARQQLPTREEYRFCGADVAVLPVVDFDRAAIESRAEDLLTGRMPALGFDWQFRDEPDIWRRAPDTGRLWPADFFGRIPYRAGNPYGDVRVAWEPARLQQLVLLAALAENAGAADAARAAALAQRQLLSFCRWNPPLTGIHYVSAMECGLRVIAACHAVDMLRGRLPEPRAVSEALIQLVAGHCDLIARRPSRFSSAGNHSIAEAAGLVYGGILFPELPAASRWLRLGIDTLAREVPRQLLEDGGSLEQSFWYQRFVHELATLSLRLLDSVNVSTPALLADRVRRGGQFRAAVRLANGASPDVGDRDDGVALSFALREPAAVPAAGISVRTLADSGYSMLTGPADDGLQVLMDHGPLGMPPSAGHGHADGLAVQAWVHGRPLLVDVGTGSYTGDADWRRYFRSTAAHNTVCVDGADQARQRTAFMWSEAYQCVLLRAERHPATVRVLARHDGYVRRAGAWHVRGVALRADGSVLIWDRVDGSGHHTVELNWHTLEVVGFEGRRCRLVGDMRADILGGQSITVARGELAPRRGWHAPVYGRIAPACTITATHVGSLPCEFVTLLSSAGRGEPGSPEPDIAVFRSWLT